MSTDTVRNIKYIAIKTYSLLNKYINDLTPLVLPAFILPWSTEQIPVPPYICIFFDFLGKERFRGISCMKHWTRWVLS